MLSIFDKQLALSCRMCNLLPALLPVALGFIQGVLQGALLSLCFTVHQRI